MAEIATQIPKTWIQAVFLEIKFCPWNMLCTFSLKFLMSYCDCDLFHLPHDMCCRALDLGFEWLFLFCFYKEYLQQAQDMIENEAILLQTLGKKKESLVSLLFAPTDIITSKRSIW